MNKIIPIIIFLIFLQGCKKYEEGPFLSLKTKTERVSNTWKIERVWNDVLDFTEFYTGFNHTFTSEGYYFYHPSAGTSGNNISGTWYFGNNQEEIVIESFDQDGVKIFTVYTIKKLKENELWMVNKATGMEWIMIPS